jgi:hypothetical protein
MTAAHKPSCKNGGVIVGDDLHPTCTCKFGFKGHDCSQKGKLTVPLSYNLAATV